MSGDEHIARFRARLQRTLQKIEQAIMDFQFVMERRPDLPPIDIEPFLVARAGFREAIAALDRGEQIKPEWIAIPPFADEEGEWDPREGKGG